MKHQTRFIFALFAKCSIVALSFFLYASNTFAQTEQNPCPNVSVKLIESDSENTKTIFQATTDVENTKITFNWTISKGTIIEGQGTNQITVSSMDSDGGVITATVEISGDFSSTCLRIASVSTDLICPPPLSPNRIEVKDLYTTKKHLETATDVLADELRNKITAKGYIFFYAGNNASKTQVKNLVDIVKAQLKKRGIGENRVVISEGNPRERTSFVIWLAYPWNDEPIPN